MLPFYIFTHPPAARALLEYRYRTLDAARQKAHSFGFRGAMYAWESADTGEETTPNVVIAPNGEVLAIRNGEMEVHITADIAFAVWNYWEATGDDDFFVQFGAEIMVEAGRFWASRGKIERDGAFHIRHVIGPDEYHEDVDDNVYTNLMAAWTLLRGAETAKLLEQRWPECCRELFNRLQFSNEETASWTKLAHAMFTGLDSKTLLFEQFKGYFDREPIDLKSFEPRAAAMDMILGHDQIQRTNIIKQADVVLAMYLLWDQIAPDARAANFYYYEPRTGHGSSLSPSIHALIAARLGNSELAQKYLKQASEIDLGNNMGNAAGGVHAAALGGLWQAIVFGFAGLKTGSDNLTFAPNLLPHWRRLAFPLQWRGRKLQIEIDPKTTRVAVSGTQPFKLGMEGGSEITAEPEGGYVAERTQQGWKPWSLVHSTA
jgi:trehalose/maltose hydrolase-like predicted phosphorylase